ncbi:two-component system chemotaxis response regulator CheB [Amycolatopsis lexingtonensis]|uniref:protein-glutamate methylesterase n=1 Tax=Amycolatopsis lexingtonensis TaxID=218822 RepID=A0ABR9HTJ9_9PSEU|nr:chemotaxis protein CheB [Amycolatopsis lexingtonensis]MBE1494259.1 two-component system chemotaxis response regulator CheB [Amycolatopsis lexingtonensis]
MRGRRETRGRPPPATGDVPAAAYPVRVPVVALVTSAGGLDALSRVLGPLPADLPAAVLVAQHLDPSRPSRLAAILDARTALRVVEARDGDELTPGTVLVAPAARHLLVTPAARIGLLDAGALPPARPSADLLLATLAVTCGPRALAVVLTGRGTDAQAGIRAVARCGGTVFAQDEATSAQFGMPGAAILTGVVDTVLPLPEIAGAVRAHVTHPAGLGRSTGATRRSGLTRLPWMRR